MLKRSAEAPRITLARWRSLPILMLEDIPFKTKDLPCAYP